MLSEKPAEIASPAPLHLGSAYSSLGFALALFKEALRSFAPERRS